jgi:cell division initiation protein
MITPIEIRQQQFRKSFRGYDPEEVQAFLKALSQEWEKQLESQRGLRAELEKIQASYRTLKEVEDMLHKTLMQAEQSSRDTLDNARQKAELLVQDAEARAREILRKGVEDRNQLQREIEELSRQRDQVLGQLQVFLQAQLDRLHAWERSELPPAHHPASGTSAPDPAPLFPARGNGSHPRGIVDDIYAEL